MKDAHEQGTGGRQRDQAHEQNHAVSPRRVVQATIGMRGAGHLPAKLEIAGDIIANEMLHQNSPPALFFD